MFGVWRAMFGVARLDEGFQECKRKGQCQSAPVFAVSL